MIRDYSSAGAGRNRSRPRKNNSRKSAPKAAAKAPTVRFHAPSFSGGIIIGAALVLIMAYLPELTALRPEGPSDDVTSASTTPQQTLRFEYEDILRNAEVTTTPGTYEQAQQETLGKDTELYLQAASFRTQEEANKLRAELLLLNLPATTDAVDLANGRWIRVNVGPFDSAVQATRAMTELRTRSIAPLWIKRKIAG